mgnify:CR=1 FL=1
MGDVASSVQKEVLVKTHIDSIAIQYKDERVETCNLQPPTLTPLVGCCLNSPPKD